MSATLAATDWQGTAEQARSRQQIYDLQRRLGNNPGDAAKLKKTCEDFESLFMAKLWQQMRATVPREGYLHSKQEEQYMGMFENELASKMASAGGIGLGKMLFDNLQQTLKSASRGTESSGVTKPIFSTPQSIPLKKAAGGEVPSVQSKGKDLPPSRSVQDELVVQIALQEAAAMVTARQNSDVRQVATPSQKREENDKWHQQMQATELAQLVIQEEYVAQGGREPVSFEDINKKAVQKLEMNPSSLPELHWPLADARKSSGFGWRNDPFTGKRAWHAGVDLAAPVGTPIESCLPGTVSFAGKKGGYGNLVIIDHPGGWQSYYGHNSENLVQIGEKVFPGKEIARVGSTGRSTGPHLHFELRQGDQAWNPEMILNRMQAGLSIGRKA